MIEFHSVDCLDTCHPPSVACTTKAMRNQGGRPTKRHKSQQAKATQRAVATLSESFDEAMASAQDLDYGRVHWLFPIVNPRMPINVAFNEARELFSDMLNRKGYVLETTSTRIREACELTDPEAIKLAEGADYVACIAGTVTRKAVAA